MVNISSLKKYGQKLPPRLNFPPHSIRSNLTTQQHSIEEMSALHWRYFIRGCICVAKLLTDGISRRRRSEGDVADGAPLLVEIDPQKSLGRVRTLRVVEGNLTKIRILSQRSRV